jgi:hypothetical protein
MTAEALIANAAKNWLCGLILLRVAGVGVVILGGELLVP